MSADWTLESLQEMVRNEIPESLTLEYKGSAALAKTEGAKKEISKDVSAFANSAGGVIVYGIEEEGHLPKRVDDGLDPSDVTKEWLEQIINSRIQRKIDGVTIHQIPINELGPDKVVYVVEIPQSIRAPHQASDKRFYKRFNFMSLPMEEYEIRDIGRREEVPDLCLESDNLNRDIELSFASIEADRRYGNVDLKLSLTNSSAEPAMYAVVSVRIPEQLGFISSKVSSKKLDGCVQAQYVHGRDDNLPLFDGINLRFMDARIKLYEPPDEEYVFSWEIRAPKMEVKNGVYVLKVREEDGKYIGLIEERS